MNRLKLETSSSFSRHTSIFTTIVPDGDFNSGQVHSGFTETERRQQNVGCKRVNTKLYSHSARSSARITFASGKFAIPLSFCLCQPNTALGGALIKAHCQHMCKHMPVGIVCVQWASRLGSGEDPAHRNLHFPYRKHIFWIDGMTDYVCLKKWNVTKYVQKIQLQLKITHELYYRDPELNIIPQQNCTECPLFLIIQQYNCGKINL